MTFTPSHLDVLLHYYVSPEKHLRWRAPAVVQHSQDLVACGLLTPRAAKDRRLGGDSEFTCTTKGAVFINALCATPLPVQQQWAMPKGDTP